MKLAEANRTQSPATTAWSPLPQQPAYLAAGTVAGTMGLDFDTSAHLEIMHVDFSNPKEQKVLGKTTAADRFHKLVWGLTGVNNESFPLGIIAGGLANGSVNLWDPSKIIRFFNLKEEYSFKIKDFSDFISAKMERNL